jgi:hypothetical protein
MKGDRVEAVVDTGQGGTQTFDITATKAGAGSRSRRPGASWRSPR